MTTISDLSADLVREILSRVPTMTSLKAVRCTCKTWNALSKDWIFCKKPAKNQYMGFMMMDSKAFSMKLDLQGIRENGNEDLVVSSIKQIDKLDQIQVSQVLQCDGLLLCVIKDNSRLLVWNPYLGQTRWIQPRKTFQKRDRYGIGYDNNRNHKILRILDDYSKSTERHIFAYEIYDFSSDSWRGLDVTPYWHIKYHQRGKEVFLLCFDFTTERFGPRLPLPKHSYALENINLSCVRDEQLAVVYQRYLGACEILDVWVTTMIEPTSLTWSTFLSVDLKSFAGFKFDEKFGSFFIDQEKKVAVVFALDIYTQTKTRYQSTYIIGQDGYFKSVKLGETLDLFKDKLHNAYGNKYFLALVCSSSYAPSLVQL